MSASLSDILPANPTPTQIAQAQEMVNALMGGQQQQPIIGAAEKRAMRRQQEAQLAQYAAQRDSDVNPDADVGPRPSRIPYGGSMQMAGGEQPIPGAPNLPPEAKSVVAALQGGAAKSPAAGGGTSSTPQYGLQAGQLPIGLPPRVAAGMLGAGYSPDEIGQVHSLLAPQYQADPVTGQQFAIMPNGRVFPVGQGIPTMGNFKAGEGLEIPYTWERHPGGIRPKFNIPTGADDDQPQASGPGVSPRMAQSPNGAPTPGDYPAGGISRTLDRIKAGQSAQAATNKERATIGEKAGESRVGSWGEAVKAGNNTYAVLQDLSTMKDAYQNSGLQGGPLQKYLQGARSVVAQLFPDSGLSDLTAPGDVIDKVNFGMATKIARELTARPTQMEVAAAMKNNPGLQMNNKGSLYMIDLMTQIQLQKQELGQMAARLPSDQVWKWPQMEQEYYENNPLKSPISGKPLQGSGAIVREIEQVGGLKSGGGADVDKMPQPLIYDPETKQFRPLQPGK